MVLNTKSSAFSPEVYQTQAHASPAPHHPEALPHVHQAERLSKVRRLYNSSLGIHDEADQPPAATQKQASASRAKLKQMNYPRPSQVVQRHG